MTAPPITDEEIARARKLAGDELRSHWEVSTVDEAIAIEARQDRFAKLVTYETIRLCDALTAARAEVDALRRERDEARAILADAEEALLESQNERDALAEQLEVYKPTPKPRKHG